MMIPILILNLFTLPRALGFMSHHGVNVDSPYRQLAALDHSYHQTQCQTCLGLFQDFNESHDQPLRMSESDLARISGLRQRKIKMPILIAGAAILPGQSMEIISRDPKLRSMIDYVLKEADHNEIGIIGLNPHNQTPLNIGVSASVTPMNMNSSSNTSHTSLTVTGNRRFEIEEEPELDESGSFYIAEVDIVEDREEMMSEEQESEAKKLSERLPGLVQKWEQLVHDKGMKRELKNIMKSLGPMPKNDLGRRALWVGKLVNPLPSLKICFEIRPAMLSCKNNYERIQLAVISLQSSIDFLSSGQSRI
eukprot:917158_1